MGCASSSGKRSEMTVVGYSYGQHSTPYKSQLPGKDITLKQFKSSLCKKGNFKYTFKRSYGEYGVGFEEVSDDKAVLPLWDGKIFCIIEPMDA